MKHTRTHSRILSILLALMMCLSLLPVTALAADDYKEIRDDVYVPTSHDGKPLVVEGLVYFTAWLNPYGGGNPKPVGGIIVGGKPDVNTTLDERIDVKDFTITLIYAFPDGTSATETVNMQKYTLSRGMLSDERYRIDGGIGGHYDYAYYYLDKPAQKFAGYTFAGWDIDDQAGHTGYLPGMLAKDNPAVDVTYTARWKSVPSAILFESNGGVLAKPDVSLYCHYGDWDGSNVVMLTDDSGVLSKLPSVTREGYTFDGWYTAQTGGTKVMDGANLRGYNNELVLYAHWVESKAEPLKTREIWFNPNGGTAKAPDGYEYVEIAHEGATLRTMSDKDSGKLSAFPTVTREGYTFDGWYTAETGGTKVSADTDLSVYQGNGGKNWAVDQVVLWAHWTSGVNPYNLGDETYSFGNYGDSDSVAGHCFGMSMTSSGYYNNILNISTIGGNANTPLYSFSRTEIVEQPICYYQNIQGTYSSRAIVAGGSFYLKGVNNIASDWKAVVNYVSNHKYDGTGTLQIGYRKGAGGHAINFLRYENVNGQDRIYAYDNNFPTRETYFYQDSSGHVLQAPSQTFSGAIDCIALRDVRTYFNLAGNFDATHVLYMAKDAATVEGEYTYSYMEAGFSDEEYIMYEIPANVDSVIIIPHRDNAEFVYMNTTYSFGEITDETRGEFKFASVNEGKDTVDTSASFQTFEDNSVISSPFTDVSEDAYYYDAVLWAVENGVTAGTGDGSTFSPNDPCTRAQIVTFLWRAYGKQKPTSTENPFTDVKPSDYYYDAVLWAVEKGITDGTGDGTTFSPNDPCTRSQAVTFQWRAASKPTVSGGSSFTDVTSGSYYADAVAWAVKNSITAGTGDGTTFSPNDPCTRAQIVTFLYREMGK